MPRVTSKMLVTELIDRLEDAGYEPRSYSGRGMHGAECVSVSTDDGESEVVISALASCQLTHHNPLLPRFVELLKTTQSDAMGRGNVYYWPDAEWPEDTDG